MAGANLLGPRNLIPKQMLALVTDEKTILLEGSRGPYRLGTLAGRRKSDPPGPNVVYLRFSPV